MRDEGQHTDARTDSTAKSSAAATFPAASAQQPIIEVDGKLQFTLPGQPLFPDLGDDTVLKPAFNWLLQSDKPGKFDAEVGYVTGGFDWSASYNLVSPEKGDIVDFVGWITMNNNSGKTFENAKIKLMAGDVNKIQPPAAYGDGRCRMMATRWQWMQPKPLPSPKKPSTNFIFIPSRARRRCTTARRNRSNSSTPKKCMRRRFTFMTARRIIDFTAD